MVGGQNISLFYLSDSNAFLLGNVFRENKNTLTVSHFIKVMEMQNIQLLELKLYHNFTFPPAGSHITVYLRYELHVDAPN
jgi:hypothetical protein